MEKFILTDTFTLIPKELYSREVGTAALKEQFSLDGGYIFNEYTFEQANAVVCYAYDEKYYNSCAPGELVYPFIVKLLDETRKIESYNKVIFHYSKSKGISHTVICMGDELKLANSFKADSFESALYFLFLAIHQLQMNPKQCIVRVCSEITQEQEETISAFFSGTEKNNLDNTII